MHTPFEELPQDQAIKKLVKKFYQYVLIDPILAPFFTGHDINRLISHQEQFFKYLLFSKESEQTFKLDDIHRPLVEKLGLSEQHFDRVVAHLTKSLTKLNAAPETMSVALTLIESTRHQILCSQTS